VTSDPPTSARPVRFATVARVLEHHPGTRSLFLALPPGERLEFTPGQFISCALPAGGTEPLVRAYSLASSPEDGELEICLDRVANGRGSAYLFECGIGAPLAFTGPFGSFALAEPPAAPLGVVGAGTGRAPIRPMVRRALERGSAQRIDVLQGARYDHELVYRADFEQWAAANARMHWEPVVGPLAALEDLVVERYVRGDDERTRRFWICGVGDMPGRLRDVLRGAGYERRAVRAESW
jgi:ferredoxin-NADP reductase